MEQKRPRNSNGTFAKGQPSPEGARRKKGTLNKITRDIREGAIAGFARHGSNGRGEGGFAGFCYYLAKKHPKAAVRIIEKLLPLTVNGSGAGIGGVNVSFNIASVPTGNFLCPDDIVRLSSPGREIEHEPSEQSTPAVIERQAQEFVPQTETERQLLAKLEFLSEEQLREIATQVGCDVDID